MGDYACVSGANFSYKESVTITAPAAGEVLDIYVHEGSDVGKDQALLYIESDSVQDQVDNAYTALRDAEIALENQEKQPVLPSLPSKEDIKVKKFLLILVGDKSMQV